MSFLSTYPTGAIKLLLASPAGFPPSGTTATATVAETLYISNLVAIIFAAVISTFALVFRLYTKLVLIKQWNIEDLLLIPAWILLVYYIAEGEIAMHAGAGRHMWNITFTQFYSALYHINVASILYCIIVGLLKVAILLQYLRIFVPNRNSNKGLRYVLYATITATVLFYVIITFCTIFICFPREAYYNPYVKGNCLGWQGMAKVVAIFAIVSDFALLIIPIFPIRKLHMARKKKVLIGCFFAIGLIDCIASVVRAYYTWYLIGSTDISWNSVGMGIWAALEMSFGVVVVCLPVSPRFYKHLRERSNALLTSWKLSRSQDTDRSKGSSSTTNLSSSISPTRPHFSSFHYGLEKDYDIQRPEGAILVKEEYKVEEFLV